MTSGTKILLSLIALFVGILVLYYGVLMPEAEPGTAVARGPARDTALAPEPGMVEAAEVVASAVGRLRGKADDPGPAPADTGPESTRE